MLLLRSTLNIKKKKSVAEIILSEWGLLQGEKSAHTQKNDNLHLPAGVSTLLVLLFGSGWLNYTLNTNIKQHMQDMKENMMWISNRQPAAELPTNSDGS